MKYLNLLAEKCNAILSVVALSLVMSTVGYGQCSLSCNGTTQVSLSSTCNAIITPNMILSDNGVSCPTGQLSVVISDTYGDLPAPGNEVTNSYMGQTLTAMVVDAVSGNTCWGNIIIEDKLGPTITDCPMGYINLDCPDMNAYPGPTFTDNCDGDLTPVLLSEQIGSPCITDVIRTVTRTYSAVDALGNIASNNCEITLRLRRFDPSRVAFPDSLTSVKNNALSCDLASNYDANGNGKIDSGELKPSDFGVPSYILFPEPGVSDTLDLYPYPDVYCNTVVTFEDIVLPRIGCTQKVMRRWRINEWHCEGETDTTYTQLIEVADDLGPTLSCQSTLELSTNTLIAAPGGNYGDFNCGAKVQLPLPTASDNCATELTYDLTYPSGHVDNYDGSELTLPMGTNVVLYTVYDNCYNSSTCHTAVSIVDDSPPIAICDQNTTVSLTTNGTATVRPESFDDGSYDDCKMHCTLVRRMNQGTCDCNTPEFCDLTYLGNRNGSNYYLSDYKISATLAKNRADSYGGALVQFDDLYEEQWLVGEVRKRWSDRFWTGIKRDGDVFTNSDHSALSYTNWAADQPSLGFGEDCVMVTPGNVWNDAACSSEQRYVLEIAEGCGFSNGAKFCCEDSGSDHMVVLRVIDFYGNHNDCMVNISVQDKSAPTLTCPESRTVACDFIYDETNLTAAFGDVSIGASCGSNVIETVSADFSEECGTGVITRVWEAVVGSGDDQQVVSHCKQTITFEKENVFTEEMITCPEQEILISGCDNPENYGPEVTGVPEYLTGPCDIVGADYNDQLFTFNNDNGDACFKILRTWEIVDWCRIDPFASFKCHQVIQVSNTSRPIISGDKPINVCSYDADCTSADVELEVFGEDDCTSAENLRWSYQVFAGSLSSGPTDFSTPVAEDSGTGGHIVASGKYPLGSHVIRWTFSDGCGNSTTSDQPFTVTNCKAATAYCINGLAVDLMPVDVEDDGTVDFGMIELWASDFDAGSYHPCGYPVQLSFSPDVTDTNKTFDCLTRGNQLVEIWSTVTTPTGELVQTYCSTFVDIQDNMNSCLGQRQVSVTGSISTEQEEMIENIAVTLEGSPMQAMTDADGSYAFPNMDIGGNYTVNPYNNEEALNGVSTLDLITIQRHILGLEILDSPYKYIAADIDNNKVINGIDLVELRKLILGIYTEFPANDSWKFVDKGYTFTNLIDPLNENFTEDYNIQAISSDMAIDFVAVKVGDVNNSAEVANTAGKPVQDNSVVLTVGQQTTLEGDIVSLPLSVNEATSGMQLEFTYDNSKIEVISLEGAQANIQAHNYVITDNKVIISWNEDLAVDGNLFNIIAVSKEEQLATNAIKLSDAQLVSEVYTDNGTILQPILKSEGTVVSGLTVSQNTPNPFQDFTNVNISLDKATTLDLRITNVQGRLVSSQQLTLVAGSHDIEISSEELGSAGIYYLHATTSTINETIKMVLID